MSAVSSWDASIAPGARRVGPDGSVAQRLLLNWEELLTLGLVVVVEMAIVFSVDRADWVAEMPSLPLTAFVGLISGWLLARTPWSALWMQLIGVSVGLALVIGMVMHSMRLSDPVAAGGIGDRWSELWARNGDWFNALIGGGVSTDPLPFVMLVVFAAWSFSYLAAWAVFRWNNVWLALLPGGIAMLSNISYLPGQPSAEFVVFLFAAMLLVTRIHLRRTIARWHGQRVVLPQFLSLEVLHLSAWVGVALIVAAWLIPAGDNFGPVARVWNGVISPITDRLEPLGRVFIGIDGKRDSLIHSFDTALPLQGRVRLGDELLFTVRSPEPVYLRSTAFDEYARQGWRISSSDREPLPGTTVEAASFGTPDTRTQLRRPITVEIEVTTPLSDRRLLTPGEPLAADVDADLIVGALSADVLALRPAERVRDGDRYIAVGTVTAADVGLLAGAGTEYPEWVLQRYLQLPDDLPVEIGELARQVAGGASSPYLAAVQIETFLRANYPYELRVSDPPPRGDAVAYFLFVEQQGYFDHHASAMAVMLRTLGVPARVAVGYSLDESAFDAVSKSYLVTEQQSWTWPEVFFPGLGWVEFNPTPGRAQLVRDGSPAFLLDLAEFETVAGAFDVDIQEAVLLAESELFSQALAAQGSGVLATSSTVLRWMLLLGALVVVVILGGRASWAYGFRGLSPATARWAKLQRLSSWAGVAAAEHRTPIEAAEELSTVLGPGAGVRPLAQAFTAERYGAEDVTEDEQEALGRTTVYLQARNRLMRRTLRRLIGVSGRRADRPSP